MEKQKYFVSMQDKVIMTSNENVPYEFEIEATAKEADQLQEMFDFHQTLDQDVFIRAHIPGISYHHDLENDALDEQTRAIYHMLHRLGTPETQQHIASMNFQFED